MSSVPEAVDKHMRRVLEGIIRQLGGTDDDTALVQSHAWYDANYVGWVGDRIAAWRGYSANLRSLGEYRTLYVNFVENPFSLEENTSLFGEIFAIAVSHLDEYVCIYVTNCPVKVSDDVSKLGFTYKRFKRNIHPSRVVPLSAFLQQESAWIKDGVQLVLFQCESC